MLNVSWLIDCNNNLDKISFLIWKTIFLWYDQQVQKLLDDWSWEKTLTKIEHNHKSGNVGGIQRQFGQPYKLIPRTVHFIRWLVTNTVNEIKNVCTMNVSTITLNKTGLYTWPMTT